MAHTGIITDTTHFPLVIKRVGNAFSLDDMKRYLVDLDRLHQRQEPFAAIVLVKDKGPLDRGAVTEYGRWVKQNQERMKQYYLGSAFVFPGEVFRFLLSTILIAAPAPVPHAVFGKPWEAAEWALEKLRKAGVKAPAITPGDLE